MGRGDRHLHTNDGASADTSRMLDDTRTDAHVWIDRAFDAVSGFMQGVSEVVRGAGDIAAGRRPKPGPVYPSPVHPGRPSSAPHVNLDELGEWYIDEMIAAETGRKIYAVTNGSRIVECHSREMAEQVLGALNEQGVRTRAAESRAESRAAHGSVENRAGHGSERR